MPSRRVISTLVADLSGNSIVGPELGWDACAPGGTHCKNLQVVVTDSVSLRIGRPRNERAPSLKSSTAQKNWINVQSLLDWAVITWTTPCCHSEPARADGTSLGPTPHMPPLWEPALLLQCSKVSIPHPMDAVAMPAATRHHSPMTLRHQMKRILLVPSWDHGCPSYSVHSTPGGKHPIRPGLSEIQHPV